MSYRDLRNFSEHLRILGFPRPVSLDSFREPNFPLLAELLKWLAERFDPDSDVTGGPESMEERIMIIRSAAKFMAVKANIKLNTKKLYGADGYAVRELLKITSVLYEALTNKTGLDVDDRDGVDLQYDVSSKIAEIKHARQLATEITAKGALLYDLLANEPEYKEVREQALGRQLDMSHMETALQKATQAARQQIESVREQIASVAASETALSAKIEKKRGELERGEKRLQSMHKIKPAYQGELAALETELEGLWDQYVLRHRCVEALKHQLSVVERTQAEAAEEQQAAVLQLIHKYEAEDVLGNVSDSDEVGSGDEQRSTFEKEPRPATRPKTRLRIKTANKTRDGDEARRGMFGSIGGRDELDDVPDEEDSPTDSDELSELQQSRYGARSTLRAEDSMLSRFSARTDARAPHALTRHLSRDDDNDDFGDLIEGGEDANSLASSDESELQLAVSTSGGGGLGGGSASRRRAPSTKPSTGLHDIMSDDEF